MNYLSLLQITRWIPRPIVPACWVVVKDVIILSETQDLLGHLSSQEKELFRAILRAFAFPENILDKVQLFNLEEGAFQFKFVPALLWVWGEDLGKRLLDLYADAYPFPIRVSPGLRKLLRDPSHKRKLWNDGHSILEKFAHVALSPLN